MSINRRNLLAGGLGAGASGLAPAYAGPSPQDLDRAAAAPVLKREGLRLPVIIDSIRLLKQDREYIVQVRSKDGAEGVSLTNPPRAEYLDKILKQLVIPAFLGKDARDLENLLWELYRRQDNYKLYGLALWSPQAWVEFAILDMLGRIARKSIGELVGDIVRRDVAIYVASGRRDTTPEQEVEYLRKLLDQSGAKALKFRVGGRMSRNADAMPGRTDKLIPLVRKTVGDTIDIHADSNSSYDPPQAIRVGRMLEEIKAVYFEEPCPFDHLEDTKVVADALTIPVAGGEQEYSDWRFRWMIANRGVDIVQPDLFYYGGMIRSIRVARMAALAKMPTTVHISGGFGFVYMLHFASSVPDIGRYQEYKLGTEKYGSWFDPPLLVKNGRMTVPAGPGVGIKDVAGLLSGAKEA
ncbi:MAG: mandelate racemase/muconate lactonizing enzyme family protein [Candidatus Solibacter usitatus]|nr:mandelate racemase/muconate lactonizing enzyme family protein [Candidatus Solibacter usitatus]